MKKRRARYIERHSSMSQCAVCGDASTIDDPIVRVEGDDLKPSHRSGLEWCYVFVCMACTAVISDAYFFKGAK